MLNSIQHLTGLKFSLQIRARFTLDLWLPNSSGHPELDSGSIHLIKTNIDRFRVKPGMTGVNILNPSPARGGLGWGGKHRNFSSEKFSSTGFSFFGSVSFFFHRKKKERNALNKLFKHR